jgi:hypothetical protein
MLSLVCLEVGVAELAQDALLGLEVFMNQGARSFSNARGRLRSCRRTPEKPVAEQQQPFMLCIQNA